MKDISIWIPVIVALVPSIGTFITVMLNRRWQKQDKTASNVVALAESVKGVKTDLSALRGVLDSHIREDELRDILQARRRIIVFADECRRGERHSEEHFNSILTDIDTYERYCNKHEDFKNKQAVLSIRFVIDVYDQCRRDNDFI